MKRGLMMVGLGVLLALAGCDSSGSSDDEADAVADVMTDTGGEAPLPTVGFVVVDTGQEACYEVKNEPVTCPAPGTDYYGTDGQYDGTAAAYEHLAGGAIVLDLNTGLMWEREHHVTKLSWSDADAACEGLALGGYDDWRMPSIKELYSLANFAGSVGGEFFLDDGWFDLEIPDEEELTGTHTNEMMGQTWSSTVRPDDAAKGYYFFNFLDGHIKSSPDGPKFTHFYRCVRGNQAVFDNDFEDNGDGTVTDRATGLVWQRDAASSGGSNRFDWKEALALCEGLELGDHDDWRLPNVKELQSIVDYNRTDPSLDTTAFGFDQESGTGAYFWASTSMLNYPNWAIYVCFGPCLSETGQDIHGPGAQRADPKLDEGKEFPDGVGDQQDVVQIENYVRCVRGMSK